MSTYHKPKESRPERSLRHGTSSKDKWYPVPLRRWLTIISYWELRGQALINDDGVARNIAYNLQYLEYVEQTLAELCLSAVIIRQSIKTHIITGISITECILFNVARTHGIKGTNLYQVILGIERDQLLGRNKRLYIDLNRFRKLRNKIHIYQLRDDLGTDYQSFGRAELSEMRRV